MKEKNKMETKVINIPRGTGKTTRLIYASEFNQIPILCTNECSKKYIIDTAERLNLDIPTPITPRDLFLRGAVYEDKILVDEGITVLRSILNQFGINNIPAITMSENKNFEDK